jgi:putative transcriptional regulator
MTTKKNKYGSAFADELIESLESLTADLSAGKLNARNVYLTVSPPDFSPADVKAARESLGLSQTLFANFIGASPSALRQWERGAKTPTPMAKRFLEAIKSDPEYWRKKLSECVAEK